jgi:predicted Zn-dependent peptidase
MTSTAVAADDVVTRAFPNGLTWIHKPVHHNRIAAIRLMMPNGASSEPAGKAGVTKLMTSVLFKGTQDRTAVQFTQAVESLGASLDAGAQEDEWELSGQATTDRFPALFSLFQEVLFRPSFPEEEVKKERAAHVNAIRASKEQIFNVAYERLQKALYPDHPYGRPEDGEESTVAALTREDVAARYRSALNPKGAVLVTVGDIPAGVLAPMIEGLAGKWTAPAEAAPLPGPVSYPKGQVLVENPEPFEQSYLMMAYPAPAFGAPDYAAVKVLNAWLGAGMSSPLFMTVREERGLAYEVASFFPTQRLGSAFVVYAGMEPNSLDSAQEGSESVVKAAVDKAPTPEELESAKRYILGHFAMDHQTNGRLAWYLGFYQMMGKGWRYDAQYPEDVRKVTAEDVHRAAQKVFGRPPVTVRIRSAKKGKH